MDERPLLELEEQFGAGRGRSCTARWRAATFWPVIGFFSSAVATGRPLRHSDAGRRVLAAAGLNLHLARDGQAVRRVERCDLGVHAVRGREVGQLDLLAEALEAVAQDVEQAALGERFEEGVEDGGLVPGRAGLRAWPRCCAVTHAGTRKACRGRVRGRDRTPAGHRARKPPWASRLSSTAASNAISLWSAGIRPPRALPGLRRNGREPHRPVTAATMSACVYSRCSSTSRCSFWQR